ncbi:hypothetical protein QQS21_008962 [Conoideocrella luteorostrata]|uniref:Major facilitator superfamily (MFS) profile domain-containing protein n=1 Tax=Conoideocrella luteorostrata TaxID=1105319 RepID=A0AAJ0CHZ3_9HYPO|nr:hypothetical protein QQS21_008962 [Conoideocrella luteorostrata]
MAAAKDEQTTQTHVAPEIEQHPPKQLAWKLPIVIVSLCLAIFLLGLDMNIIGVAVPHITTDFRSLSDIAWYGSAYLLTITAFQPFFGNLYNCSAVCAAAKTSPIFIFGRALLGFGAAGLLQGALAIIGFTVKLEKVPLFQGVVVSALGVSVCVGPVLGGVLTDTAGWRWCFWINLPIGACVIVAILLLVQIPQSTNEANRSLPLRRKLEYMDPIGTTLFLGAVCSLLLALQWGGQTYPWNSSKCIGLFVGFGAISLCFGIHQWRRADLALIPFRILRKRSIYMGALVLFFLGMSSLTYAYYLPIFFQSAQGVSTTASGVRFIALVLPQIVGLVVVGAVVSMWGYYVPYMIAGVILTSTGAGLLTTIEVSTPTVSWAAFMVINGLGIGMAQQLPYTALQAVLKPSDVATGNAIAVFSYQLGGAVSVAIAQNLLLNGLASTVPQQTDAVRASDVIAIGASGLAHLTDSPEVLHALRLAYAGALRPVFILALAAACFAFPFACGMERLNLRHVAEQRE